MRVKEHYNGRKIPLQEVLSQVTENTPIYTSGYFDGAEVNIGMLNIRLYAAKGCDCIHCKLEGKFFRVERMGRGNSIFNEWHLNLYGVNDYGTEILMTKDHIHARSKGGTDEIKNLQPMCEICNVKKKDMPMHEFQAKHKGAVQTSKLDRHFEKVARRMQERYGLNIDKEYFGQMNKKVKSARIVKDIGSGNTIREVDMHGKLIKVFFHGTQNCIISVMEDQPDEWFHTEMVPNFAKTEQERAKYLYKHILARAKEQLQVFDTPAETAKYIQSCEFPAVMFLLWKTPEQSYRISSVTWATVHKMMKSLTIQEEQAHKPQGWDEMSLEDKVKFAENQLTQNVSE